MSHCIRSARVVLDMIHLMSTANPFPTPSHPFPRQDDPVWDLALMFPLQGHWSVRDYLALDTGMLVEYTEGFIRVLPMPNVLHQLIVKLLFRLMDDHVSAHSLGEVLIAPLPVQITPDKYREPDIVFMRPHRIPDVHGHPTGADLIIEVVSPGKDNRERDYIEKRSDYAMAGVAEYWIVDPLEQKITVLNLAGQEYREHGVFECGSTATSVLLAGFQVDTNEVFARQ